MRAATLPRATDSAGSPVACPPARLPALNARSLHPSVCHPHPGPYVPAAPPPTSRNSCQCPPRPSKHPVHNPLPHCPFEFSPRPLLTTPHPWGPRRPARPRRRPGPLGARAHHPHAHQQAPLLRQPHIVHAGQAVAGAGGVGRPQPHRRGGGDAARLPGPRRLTRGVPHVARVSCRRCTAGSGAPVGEPVFGFGGGVCFCVRAQRRLGQEHKMRAGALAALVRRGAQKPCGAWAVPAAVPAHTSRALYITVLRYSAACCTNDRTYVRSYSFWSPSGAQTPCQLGDRACRSRRATGPHRP